GRCAGVRLRVGVRGLGPRLRHPGRPEHAVACARSRQHLPLLFSLGCLSAERGVARGEAIDGGISLSTGALVGSPRGVALRKGRTPLIPPGTHRLGDVQQLVSGIPLLPHLPPLPVLPPSPLRPLPPFPPS